MYRLNIQSVVLAADDTDYTLTIPTGAKYVFLRLSDSAKEWRFGVNDVSNPSNQHALVGAGEAPMLCGDAACVKMQLHFAITGGVGTEEVTLQCMVPVTR